MSLIIPSIFIFVVVFALFKKVDVFSSFTKGAGEGLKFTLSILPLLSVIFIMCQLFEVSHLSEMFTNALSPIFNFLGIPKELTKLVLIKPLSGSGSLAYLTEIIKEYGPDSYIARCACVLYGSSETVFYISAIYFAKTKNKKRILPIIIILFSTFVCAIFACKLCKIV
jgi:spore maturation protein B